METNSYGGLAGETVRLFVRLRTLLTGVPAMVATALLGGLAALLSGMLFIPPPFSGALVLIAVSPVVGRYGIGARAGDLEGGFFSMGTERGQLLPFVGGLGAPRRLQDREPEAPREPP